MEFFNASITTLQQALDVRAATQRVIAANIANVDTPGYTAQEVDFAGTMQRAIAGQSADPIVAPSAAPAEGIDCNNVDVEGELTNLEQNKFMYSVTAQVIATRMRTLSNVLDKDQS